MKFGPVATAQAQGAILAHSLETSTGRIRKGTRLTADQVQALSDTGFNTIIVAILDSGDMGEDEAAQTLANALCGASHDTDGETVGQGLEPVLVSTGRVNIHATHDGLVFADRAGIDAFNAVNPAITLATLADGTAVQTGDMVATLKIIPFAVPASAVEQASQLAKETFALQVAPPERTRIVLIQTRLPGVKESVLDKTRRHLEKRLSKLGGSIWIESRVDHDAEALSTALTDAMELTGFALERDAIVVFGSSAICDAKDVIPSAVEQAGGTVISFGMPVDPGNLLMVGRLGGSFVIGAPGCARSPAENGFDWVLARITHGLPVGPDYIAGLGVGGLLKEIKSRPQPRDPHTT
ncbi:MAG: molybdopterin-binding protein [Pseudomonadota bacterium]